MTYAIFYNIAWLIYLYAEIEGVPLKGNYDFINTTNTLIAFGIISICRRLDKLIKK